MLSPKTETEQLATTAQILAKYHGIEDLAIPDLEEVEALFSAIAPTEQIPTRGYCGPMIGLAVQLPTGRIAFRDRGQAWDYYLAHYLAQPQSSYLPRFQPRRR